MEDDQVKRFIQAIKGASDRRLLEVILKVVTAIGYGYHKDTLERVISLLKVKEVKR